MTYLPKELFLDPETYSWDFNKYDIKADLSPLDNFRYPPATEATLFFKRSAFIRLKSLKNPFLCLFYKRWIRELEEIASVSVRRYYLKPEYYSKAVREIYRLGRILELKETNIHNVCCVFQWDNAYLARLMTYIVRLNKQNLIHNPKQEINKMLKFAIATDDNKLVQAKYEVIRKVFNLLWIFIRKYVIIVAKEIRLDEFAMSEEDLKWAYK